MSAAARPKAIWPLSERFTCMLIVDKLAWRVVAATFDTERLVTGRRGCGRRHVAVAAEHVEKTAFRNYGRSTDAGHAEVDTSQAHLVGAFNKIDLLQPETLHATAVP